MAKKGTSIRDSEQGFAALIISMVLVMVLSLITIGFAQLMQREQRSSLDRQLNSEAYYAAESAINDANRALQSGYSKAKTECDNSATSVDYSMAGSEYLRNTDVDSKTATKYTCLLINPNPADLQYSSIPVNEATTAIVTGADNTGATTNISKLVFSWQDDKGGRTFTPSGRYSSTGNSWFPPSSSWTDAGQAITGMLRISITPMSNLDRQYLINNTYTAYLYPERSTSTTDISTMSTQPMNNNVGGNSGQVHNGRCNDQNAPRYCSVAVDLGGYSGSSFVVHLSSIYRATSVTVTAYSNTGAKVYIKGAQTLIDATGKAQDVLKRVQVRIPARNGYDYPEFSLQTTDTICKQLSAYPPNQATGTPGGANTACGGL